MEDVDRLRREGYNPWEYYSADERIQKVLDQIRDGLLNENTELYKPIIDSLLHNGDYFLVLADLAMYIEEQGKVDKLYHDPAAWNKMALLNSARVGKFSSDRTIKDYAEEIWQVM